MANRFSVGAILAQDDNTDIEKQVPALKPWDCCPDVSSRRVSLRSLAKMALAACGQRCRFPLDVASETCQGDCIWDAGHTFEVFDGRRPLVQHARWFDAVSAQHARWSPPSRTAIKQTLARLEGVHGAR